MLIVHAIMSEENPHMSFYVFLHFDIDFVDCFGYISH